MLQSLATELSIEQLLSVSAGLLIGGIILYKLVNVAAKLFNTSLAYFVYLLNYVMWSYWRWRCILLNPGMDSLGQSLVRVKWRDGVGMAELVSCNGFTDNGVGHALPDLTDKDYKVSDRTTALPTFWALFYRKLMVTVQGQDWARNGRPVDYEALCRMAVRMVDDLGVRPSHSLQYLPLVFKCLKSEQYVCFDWSKALGAQR